MASRVRIERTGEREFTVHAPDSIRVHVAGTAKDAIKRAEQLAKAQEKLGFQDVERMWLIEGVADKRKGKKRIPAYERAVALKRQIDAEKSVKAPKTYNPFESKLARRGAIVTNAEALAAFATIGGIKKGDTIKTYLWDGAEHDTRTNGQFGEGNEIVRVDQVRKFKDSHRSFVAVVGKAQRGRNVYTKTSLIIPLEFIYNVQQAGKGSKYRPDHEGFYVLEKARGGGAKLLDRAALDKVDAAYRKKNKPWWKFWS